MTTRAEPAAPALQWTDELALGVPRVDDTHREFVDCYQVLAAAETPDARLAALETFLAHCERHFAQEDRWMKIVGFPGCHEAEHARVLGVLREIRDLLAQGDATWLAQLIREIPEWFLTHAAGMDSALVLFLNERGFDFERETLPDGAQPFTCGPAACTTASGGC